jgi:tetratricopeptide (TPR) repeat protein
MRKRELIAGLTIAVGIATSALLSNHIEKVRPALPDDYIDSDLQVQGKRLKGFVFGMDGLVADWYFVRSLQYIGYKLVKKEGEINLDDLRDLNPRLLYPLLDSATDLDPHYMIAYSYGAIVLPAIDPEKAIAIAKKGIANNPTQWRLHQYLGYVYWRLKQYDDAAAAFEDGSKVEGAPPFMRLMAAAMKSEGGSRATARTIYSQMLKESDDEAVRSTAEKNLMELDSLDERDAIDAALAEFRERSGRCAQSFAEITSMLMSARLPNGREFRVDAQRRLVDPTDAPYVLDAAACKVRLDVGRTKLSVR